MSFDQRGSFGVPVGYVNTFGKVPQWLNSRLVYGDGQTDLYELNVLRNAAQSDFEACWPCCLDSRVCAHMRRCARARWRAQRVLEARYRLARVLV